MGEAYLVQGAPSYSSKLYEGSTVRDYYAFSVQVKETTSSSVVSTVTSGSLNLSFAPTYVDFTAKGGSGRVFAGSSKSVSPVTSTIFSQLTYTLTFTLSGSTLTYSMTYSSSHWGAGGTLEETVTGYVVLV